MPLRRKRAVALAAGAGLLAAAATVWLVFLPARAEEPAPISEHHGLELRLPAQQSPNQAAPTPEEIGVEESAVLITNTAPADLIEGILQARDRSDRAWLARTLASTAGKALITEVDLHAANRQYLTSSSKWIWTAVEAAWQAHDYTVIEKGETAEVNFKAGSSLGELTIVLVRFGECWFYAGT
jgi:hypothetical protein